MNRILSTAFTAVSLFCIATLAFPVRAQEKYNLRNIDEVGDVYLVDSTFKMIVGMRASDDPADAFDEQMSSEAHRKYTSTVLAVGATGALAERRAYDISQNAALTVQGKKSETHSVEGKTVLLKNQGGKTTVSVANGIISPEDRAELIGEFTDRVSWLPKQPVVIGDTWNIDGNRLRKEFGIADGTQSVRGALAEAVTYKNHSCLRLHYVIEMDGQGTGQPYVTHLKLEGDGYYALDLKRLLDVRMQGPITMREPGKGTQARMGGTLTLEQKVDWKKVGGKPVVVSDQK